MPAKGLLVKRSLKEYGPRKDERKVRRRELFERNKAIYSSGATIKSDENPHYINDVKEFFSCSTHKVYKGRRGCIVGQGELKGGGFDPLFSLNHSFAMFRANINRLFRRNLEYDEEKRAIGVGYYDLLSFITILSLFDIRVFNFSNNSKLIFKNLFAQLRLFLRSSTVRL